MAWNNPKKNWKAGDTPNSGDFNRIEENIEWVQKNAGKVETVNNKLPDENKNINILPADMKHNAKYNAYGNLKEMFDLLDDVSIIRGKSTSQSLRVNAITGSDNNDGSYGNPVKTLEKAFELIPKFGTTGVTIMFESDIVVEGELPIIDYVSIPFVSLSGSNRSLTLKGVSGLNVQSSLCDFRMSGLTINFKGLMGLDLDGIKYTRITNCDFNGEQNHSWWGLSFRNCSLVSIQSCKFNNFTKASVKNEGSFAILDRVTLNVPTGSIGLKVTDGGICNAFDGSHTGGTKYEANKSGQIFQNAKIHT